LKVTDRAVTEFARLLFHRVAQKYGGDCTVNELRVMNAVYVSNYKRETCTPTLIAITTDIPKSTVSRSLANLIDKGWLIDRKDAEDRRRRIIELSQEAKKQRKAEIAEASEWIVALLQNAD
jgi:DNA-binding MarR family transcriptional regulator